MDKQFQQNMHIEISCSFLKGLSIIMSLRYSHSDILIFLYILIAEKKKQENIKEVTLKVKTFLFRQIVFLKL